MASAAAVASNRVRKMKAVQIADYGGVEVLEVRDVRRPEPGPDQVLVAVRAAGINPARARCVLAWFEISSR
jgi:hypothetical protein